MAGGSRTSQFLSETRYRIALMLLGGFVSILLGRSWGTYAFWGVMSGMAIDMQLERRRAKE
jgi:hypothetical protein